MNRRITALCLALPLGLVACQEEEDNCARVVEASGKAQAALVKQISKLEEHSAALEKELDEARATLAFEHSTEGFGKTTWGLTRYQVRRIYPKAEVQDPTTLVLDREIEEHTLRTYFKFSQNKLTYVQLVPRDNAFGVDGHAAIYRDLMKLLVRKYGKPMPDQRADERSARLEKNWETEQTRIQLVFIQNNVEPVLQLEYYSTALDYLREQSAADRQLEDL